MGVSSSPSKNTASTELSRIRPYKIDSIKIRNRKFDVEGVNEGTISNGDGDCFCHAL